MVQFTQLRLSGFKSFVEPTDLLVEPGLTGVVGPNGCGKSNIVEAIRWVMGESSAKQMRGGEMDDVIFAGTRNRPARNVAEVVLTLDNHDRAAPTSLNTSDILDISRKINRGGGSTYKVNSKDVRARDIQLLFADAATGARSTAIVSQGRISALIAATPAQRRSLLEEAAGISGLHSRRHEAELRLRAAENNLTRLDDVLNALETQKQGLDRQAKQAARYRTLSEDIRALEIALTYRNAQDTEAALSEAKQALKSTEALVASTAESASQASRHQFEVLAAMEPAREAANTANTELQRLTLAKENLQQDERRLERAIRGNAERLNQIRQDMTQADQHCTDATRRQSEISAELADILQDIDDAPAAQQHAEDGLKHAENLRDATEKALNQITNKRATAQAAHKAAQQQRADAEHTQSRLTTRLQALDTEIAAVRRKLYDAETLAKAETTANTTQAFVESCIEQCNHAEQQRATAETEHTAARTHFVEADDALRRVLSEIKALENILSGGQVTACNLAPILNKVRAHSGYEAAVAALLDHGADAPEDEPQTAPARAWRSYPSFASPIRAPEGTTPLTHHVNAPAPLSRRLSLAYLVDTTDRADLIAPTLQPGQCLVTQDGGLWRWDGFVIRPGVPSSAATQLRQANHLQGLQDQLPDLQTHQAEAQQSHENAKAMSHEADIANRDARNALRQAESDAIAARKAYERLIREQADTSDRLKRLQDTHTEVTRDLADATAIMASLEIDTPEQTLSDLDTVYQNAQTEVTNARQRAAEARAQRDAIQRECVSKTQRKDALTAESHAWSTREATAIAHRNTLQERLHTTHKERDELSKRPQALAERREALTANLITAEATRNTTSDALVVCETALRAADALLKDAEHAAASAREDRVRAESTVERRSQARMDIHNRCRENLGCSIDTLDTSTAKKFTDLSSEDLTNRTERRTLERERLGPVNLRAEIESEEILKQINALITERDDLLSAIARLRQGISELNREGKNRLQKSFEAVNQAFKDIFVVLFGGGNAYLTMVENDDPLAAGLEIMASPPGKRLQMLSLLSGGEQALTALALLFAVFQSNPAPICILDEVDAPLDDANVERFCNLLSQMSKDSQTRFLIITHHRMTMARMDRLYGVTMVEQGVSQLVSVDLKVAETLREDPLGP